MTTQNWPDPKRPGVPMFPERDGAHAIQVPDLEQTDLVYYWHHNGGGWTEYNHQGPEHFLTDEDMQGWIYKGPVLTPTQINEMLAAERDRCAKTCEAEQIPDFSMPEQWHNNGCKHSARAIRNLGAAP